jgi:hypothetical protein
MQQQSEKFSFHTNESIQHSRETIPTYVCVIWIYDNCNADTESSACSFGVVYINDTGLNGNTFFTGSTDLTVTEIGVFQIAD